jgi:hypothetical protein
MRMKQYFAEADINLEGRRSDDDSHATSADSDILIRIPSLNRSSENFWPQPSTTYHFNRTKSSGQNYPTQRCHEKQQSGSFKDPRDHSPCRSQRSPERRNNGTHERSKVDISEDTFFSLYHNNRGHQQKSPGLRYNSPEMAKSSWSATRSPSPLNYSDEESTGCNFGHSRLHLVQDDGYSHLQRSPSSSPPPRTASSSGSMRRPRVMAQRQSAGGGCGGGDWFDEDPLDDTYDHHDFGAEGVAHDARPNLYFQAEAPGARLARPPPSASRRTPQVSPAVGFRPGSADQVPPLRSKLAPIRPRGSPVIGPPGSTFEGHKCPDKRVASLPRLDDCDCPGPIRAASAPDGRQSQVGRAGGAGDGAVSSMGRSLAMRLTGRESQAAPMAPEQAALRAAFSEMVLERRCRARAWRLARCFAI